MHEWEQVGMDEREIKQMYANAVPQQWDLRVIRQKEIELKGRSRKST